MLTKRRGKIQSGSAQLKEPRSCPACHAEILPDVTRRWNGADVWGHRGYFIPCPECETDVRFLHSELNGVRYD